MQITVEQLASLVQGKVHGNARQPIASARSFQEAGPGDITFIENVRNLRLLSECRAGVVVVPPGSLDRLPDTEKTFIFLEVAEPLLAFVKIVQHFQGQPEPLPAILHEMAHIHPSANLGDGCAVMPFAVIGAGSRLGQRCQIHPQVVIGRDCVIGDDVILYPGVVVYDRTVIGNRVTVHSHSVLGADGFGYRQQGARHVKVLQLGYVEIGDDVEIGACTTIDRGTFQATRIGEGTKIDNLVQIAHNCAIGRHNLIVSQVGIAGSSVTGDYVVLAGQAGVIDHITIGDGAIVGARSAVLTSIPPGQRVLGYPALPEVQAKRILLSLPHLPALRKEVRQILARLEGQDSPDDNGAKDAA